MKNASVLRKHVTVLFVMSCCFIFQVSASAQQNASTVNGQNLGERMKDLDAQCKKDPHCLDHVSSFEKALYQKSKDDPEYIPHLESSINNFANECKKDPSCQKRLDEAPAYAETLRNFQKSCATVSGEVKMTKALARDFTEATGLRTLYGLTTAIFGTVTIVTAPIDLTGVGVLGTLALAGFTSQQAMELATALSYNTKESYQCVIPDANGCPADVKRGRKNVENYLADVGVTKFKKYQYGDYALGSALPPMYFWCKDGNHATNAVQSTSSTTTKNPIRENNSAGSNYVAPAVIDATVAH